MPIDVVCTGCRRRLAVRDEFAGRQVRCPGCGAMVTALPPAPPSTGPLLPGFAGPFFAPLAPAALEAPRRPWTTLFRAPSAFFASLGARPTIGDAAKVGLPFLLLGSAGTSIWVWLALRRFGPAVAEAWTSAGLGETPFDSAPTFWTVLRGQFLMDAVGLILFPLALHLGASLFGASGLKKTTCIYYHSLVARILDLLPFGFIVSMVYLLILNYLGMRHVHGLSEGRSLGAVLIALLLGAFAILILFSCFALLQGLRMSLPG